MVATKLCRQAMLLEVLRVNAAQRIDSAFNLIVRGRRSGQPSSLR